MSTLKWIVCLTLLTSGAAMASSSAFSERKTYRANEGGHGNKTREPLEPEGGGIESSLRFDSATFRAYLAAGNKERVFQCEASLKLPCKDLDNPDSYVLLLPDWSAIWHAPTGSEKKVIVSEMEN